MVSQLLQAWAGGEPAALDQLTLGGCLELHRMAASYMRKERSGDTLQATELVHEVFLRLVEVERVSWQDSRALLRGVRQHDAAAAGGSCASPRRIEARR